MGICSGPARLNMNDSWRTGFDVQTTSNSAYMRFYDISFLDRLVSDIFIEGTPGRSRFALTSYYFQGLRSSDIQSQIPLYPAPAGSLLHSHPQGGGRRLPLRSQRRFHRPQQSDVNSQRLTAEMEWKRPFVLPNGQLWTFVLNARGDGYRFEHRRARASDTTIKRGTAYAALDWRWPFVASGGGGRSYIIQPIAQLIAQPYGGNPAGLRIEDANDFEFDDNNVFSFNQVPGYDLIESGPPRQCRRNGEALFPAARCRPSWDRPTA